MVNQSAVLSFNSLIFKSKNTLSIQLEVLRVMMEYDVAEICRSIIWYNLVLICCDENYICNIPLNYIMTDYINYVDFSYALKSSMSVSSWLGAK